MGLFDSFTIECPKCGRLLEFQSKSGPCMCTTFTKKDISSIVAVGMDGDIVECEFCRVNWQIHFNFPKKMKMKLVQTDKKSNYPGNYNPKHPLRIRMQKEFEKIATRK